MNFQIRGTALILFICWSLNCFSQGDTLHFTLKGSLIYSDYDNPPAVNKLVCLITGSDTVEVVFTDSLGKFAFKNELRKEPGKYTVRVTTRLSSASVIDLAGLKYSQDFVLNLVMPERLKPRRPDMSAYFEKGKYKTFLNFETGWLKQLLDEYPQMCIEFAVTQFGDESEKLAGKRMKIFRKALVDAGIDESRYILSDKVYYLSENKGSYRNYSPAVQGKVISMEGPCK